MIDAAERERSPTAPALPLVRLRVSGSTLECSVFG